VKVVVGVVVGRVVSGLVVNVCSVVVGSMREVEDEGGKEALKCCVLERGQKLNLGFWQIQFLLRAHLNLICTPLLLIWVAFICFLHAIPYIITTHSMNLVLFYFMYLLFH